MDEAVEPFKLHFNIYGVGALSPVLDVHMAAHSHRHNYRHFLRFGRAG
jgi:hypothetical protein